jgi:AAA ATPase domain
MSPSGPPPDGSSLVQGRTGGRVVTSGKSPNAAGGLVGRDEELGRVLALLAAARGGVAGGLVVSGEAGIGKTTLLQAAEELAGGFACLWAHGVESEAALGHAALLELLGPVRDRLADPSTNTRR